MCLFLVYGGCCKLLTLFVDLIWWLCLVVLLFWFGFVFLFVGLLFFMLLGVDGIVFVGCLVVGLDWWI